MSKVCVFVPCYKYAHFLRECVESVLAQSGVEVRVLIIDDASPDNTPEVAAELLAQDSRVSYRRHETNKGHIATYNEGLAWAENGDYTVLLSADDMLTPGALRRATRLLDAHPEVGFVYGRSFEIITDGSQSQSQARMQLGEGKWQIQSGLDFLKWAFTNERFIVSAPTVVTRTRLQRVLGGYRPELPQRGDTEMWMRFAANAAVGKILDAHQGVYRIHSQNMHYEYSLFSYQDMLQLKLAIDTLFREYGDHIPEWLKDLGNRRMARAALWCACLAYDRRELAMTPMNELIDIGTKTYQGKLPDLKYLHAYLSLRLRMLLGPKVSPLLRDIREGLILKLRN